MIFYDFEVFRYDWLVVLRDITSEQDIETVIVNDQEKLQHFYDEHQYDIWTGFNSRHYDRWILKAILCGLDPKEMNDWIIVQKNEPWLFSSLLREIALRRFQTAKKEP